MMIADIDHYLAGVDEPQRSALAELRQHIRAALPDAEECISYGMPAFKQHGKAVAGFAAFSDHLSYFPHSGTVLATLAAYLTGYRSTKGALHFSTDGLPAPLVDKLLTARLAELGVEA